MLNTHEYKRRSVRGRIRGPLVVLLGAIVATALRAQQPEAPAPKAPDSATVAAQVRQFAGAFNQMGPMYETMMSSMVRGTLMALADSGNVERLATFSRSYYLALVRHGFTREEALQIVAGFGIPLRPGR